MTEVWKSGDKERLQQSINRNRPSFPAMMFMGIMDVMMFSSMMSFMGLAMSIFMPDISMYNSPPADTGNDGGDTGHDVGGGDLGHSDFGHDFGGFDINF